jgi:hypothetical protein
VNRQITAKAQDSPAAAAAAATADVNAQGKWYPTYKISKATSFTVVYAGDSHDCANLDTRGPWRYFEVVS